MIQIIAGEKGKGKTKVLLEKVNEEVKAVKGNVVYLDKSNKHMYELNNKIRLINVKDYLIDNFNEFLGFIGGLISSDHDLEKVYVDSFLKVANLGENEMETVLKKLSRISQTFKIDFVISISVSDTDLPEEYKGNVIVSL